VAGRTKVSLKKEDRLLAKRKVAAFLASALEREFPDAKCALHHNGPEQLLFATILSAQCTDERVNKVTPALFARFPDSGCLAKARLPEVEKLIASVNFFRTKAKNLIGAAKMIQEKFGGELPRTIEELTELPGVGRKTANVLLGESFGLPLGIVVDTHVRRLANLIGLTEEESPEKIEQDLMEFLPKEVWTKFSHWLILHGRKTCIARRPRCGECVVRSHCVYGRKAPL
jgi:endonuclease-3